MIHNFQASESRNIVSKALSAFFAVSIGFCAYGYAASSSPTEIIVRLRDAQNTPTEAAMSLHGVLTPNASLRAKVELVNGTEGVVKMKFSSPLEASLAMAQLQKSSNVLNVSPNHLYRPAMKYRFQDIVQKPSLHAFSVPFLQLLADTASAIPDYQEPTGSVTPGVDPLEEKDWAIANIRLPALAEVASTVAHPLTAAVIDTGVDYNHEDLNRAMWRSDASPLEVGYDFVHNNAKPYDVVHFDIEGCFKDMMCSVLGQTDKYLVNPGHGTHCAGHVGAVANNSLGIRGVGAGNHVMALKFFYDFGEENAGAGDDAAAVKAIDYAVKNGAKVISASWGGYQKRAEAEASELKQALIRARDAGVIFVVAAGNGDPMTGEAVDQDTVAEPSYPAAYDLDNIITVAAIDVNDKIASFSNYGAKSVHIGAPGVKILSTISGGGYSDLVTKFTNPNTGKEQELAWDGTSMATPIVAGAVSLLWAQHPELSYKEVRELILSTARKIPALEGKVSSGGTLDIGAALAAANQR